ncbi:MAG: hypothetical protein PHT53_03645 [Candidatus Omnitrophica bacterium]|nr:hypothetical protein [Candidatus Omnitrophota bacterium]
MVSESFTKCLDEANKLWYGVISLIITLSSSFLVLSIALIEKLFPPIANLINLPKLLIMSWVLLFLSIIFGIIAELEAAVFHSNQARVRGRVIHELNQKIASGMDEDIIEIKNDTDYIVPGKIIWGAININCFILAILCMCLALLRKIIPKNNCIIIFITAIIFIAAINIYLLRKRKK